MSKGDQGYFFETSASLQDQQRRAKKSKNTAGNPITLGSKALVILADPTHGERIFVAESGGTARRVQLDTGDKSHVFKGPSATPLTCLALNSSATIVFAGCWDQSVWSWDVASRRPGRRYTAHSDFVKAVVCVRREQSSVEQGELLLSGGADRKVVGQDVGTGDVLFVYREDGLRGILALAVVPGDDTGDGGALTVYVGSSDPLVRCFQYNPKKADQEGAKQQAVETGTAPFNTHETSVNALAYVPVEEGLAQGEGDATGAALLTASSDGTAKRLSLNSGKVQATFNHGDYVRAVLVCGTDLVITAGRSEDVKVWDWDTGEEICVWEGHYDEVLGLALVRGGKAVASAGVDCTVRCWSLDAGDMERNMQERQRRLDGEDQDETEDEPDAEKKEQKQVELTEDEERELAELMDED